MTLVEIKKKIHHAWRNYVTLNNVVLSVALLIAASWVWGSISVMQTNFEAQRSVDDQKRQLELTQLQVDTLKYQNNYYQSSEYKDLAARTNLGLVLPGEKILVLPPNSDQVKQEDAVEQETAVAGTKKNASGSNFSQWVKFLTGQSAQALQK